MFADIVNERFKTFTLYTYSTYTTISPHTSCECKYNTVVTFTHYTHSSHPHTLTPSLQEPSEKRPLLGIRAYLAPVYSVHGSLDHHHALTHSHPHEVTYERTTSTSALDWSQEFDAINLPHFGRQYIQLVHTPLDVMHECLKLQLGLQLPEKPSPLSLRQVSVYLSFSLSHTHTYRSTLSHITYIRKYTC